MSFKFLDDLFSGALDEPQPNQKVFSNKIVEPTLD
jgi:RNase P/RNase MRP subunit p29